MEEPRPKKLLDQVRACPELTEGMPYAIRAAAGQCKHDSYLPPSRSQQAAKISTSIGSHSASNVPVLVAVPLGCAVAPTIGKDQGERVPKPAAVSGLAHRSWLFANPAHCPGGAKGYAVG
jgi:hypothetical protein